MLAPHVRHGGFYWDDWENAATTRHPPDLFLGPIDLGTLTYRPGLAIALALPHQLLGPRPALHLALAVALAVVMSVSFLALLRTLGLPPLPAAAIAALVLVFPWSDSTRLWATASINDLAIVFYLLGVLLALRGLAARDRRRRRRLTVAAVALLVLSVLTYEVTALAALLSVAFYLRRLPRPAALRRWALDLGAVGAAIALVGADTTRRIHTPAGVLEHGRVTVAQAGRLLAMAAEPFGRPPTAAVLGALAAVLLAAVLLARRRGRRDAAAPELRRWLLATGAGVVAIAVGYALFVLGDAQYVPLSDGLDNRTNIFSALGYATVVVSVAMLAGTLLFGHRRRAATALATLAAAAIAVGWIARLERDVGRWDRATALQDQVLHSIRRAVPGPPPHSAVYAFGTPTWLGGRVPVFASTFDLNGALKVVYDEPSLSGLSVGPGGEVRCERSTVAPAPTLNNRAQPAPYGRVWFVDARSGHGRRIDSAAACRREARRLGARVGAPAA